MCIKYHCYCPKYHCIWQIFTVFATYKCFGHTYHCISPTYPKLKFIFPEYYCNFLKYPNFPKFPPKTLNLVENGFPPLQLSLSSKHLKEILTALDWRCRKAREKIWLTTELINQFITTVFEQQPLASPGFQFMGNKQFRMEFFWKHKFALISRNILLRTQTLNFYMEKLLKKVFKDAN